MEGRQKMARFILFLAAILLLLPFAKGDFKPRNFCEIIYNAMDTFGSSRFVKPYARNYYLQQQPNFNPADCPEELETNHTLEQQMLDHTLAFGVLALYLHKEQFNPTHRASRPLAFEGKCRTAIVKRWIDRKPTFQLEPLCFSPEQHVQYMQMEEFLNKTVGAGRTFDCDPNMVHLLEFYLVLNDWMQKDCSVYVQDMDPDKGWEDPRPEPLTPGNVQEKFNEFRRKKCTEKHGKAVCDRMYPAKKKDDPPPVVNIHDHPDFKKLKETLEAIEDIPLAICKEKPAKFPDLASAKRWNDMCPDKPVKHYPREPELDILSDEFAESAITDPKFHKWLNDQKTKEKDPLAYDKDLKHRAEKLLEELRAVKGDRSMKNEL